MTDGNGQVADAIDKIENRPEIRFTFHGPTSAEADVHVEGVNEIQIFGAAKMLEQIGVEHMARRAMESQMQAARAGGIVVPGADTVREFRKQ